MNKTQSIKQWSKMDNQKRKQNNANPKKNKRTKNEQALSNKALEHFKLLGKDTDEHKHMYQCLLCTTDARPVNGKKIYNLCQHLKHVHSKFYYEHIDTRHKDPLPVKRLKLLMNAVEIVSVNGRPFNYLRDSGYMAGIENKLRKLQQAGIGVDFHNLTEVKDHLSKMAENVRIRIRQELQGKAICLMADICTKNSRSIFGISAQFIVSGKVQVRSLGLFELDKNHTGVYLAQVLNDCMVKFGIEKWQVFCITTDNGKNVKKMVREFNQMTASNSLNVDDSTNTNLENQSNDCEQGQFFTDNEIQQILAETNEITDDDAYDMMFETQQLDANSALLSTLSTIFIGTDQIWDTTGINCIVHTLQLAIKESCENLAHGHINVINLAREVAKFLRNQSNRREMEEKGYKLPRLECATRWCSICVMVSTKLNLSLRLIRFISIYCLFICFSSPKTKSFFEWTNINK